MSFDGFDDMQIQTMTLALAQLAVRRPGWEEYAIKPIVERLGTLEMFEELKKTAQPFEVDWLESISRIAGVDLGAL